MDDWQSRMIKDARERVARTLEHISPALIRTAQDYERIARILAPSIQKIQRHHEMTRPMLEEVLRSQQIEVPTAAPAQKDPVPETPHSRTVPIDDASCRKIATYMHEFLKNEKTETSARKSYPLPQGAKWEKLRMKFFDGHTLKVSYPGMKPGTFDYKDMGFVNRKTQNPDVKWEFLEAIADGGNRLTVSKYDKRFSRNVKYEAVKRLKSFFAMKSDPFPRYSNMNGYAPLFVILTAKDSMPLSDDRASFD